MKRCLHRRRYHDEERVLVKQVLTGIIVASLLFFSSCSKSPDCYSYGVFLSVTEDLAQLDEYETVVIDAQFFDENEIAEFKKAGHKVFSYINIGSVEDWRDYYDESLTLGAYENWDEERWVDVSREEWQMFVVEELVPELLDKGVDGFFVDNCDVYYQYPEPEIMDGLTYMMKAMVGTGKEVIINGGDAYLDAYCESGGSWDEVITGINQETVFSKIEWETDENGEDVFGVADAEDREYFMDYVERYVALGADVYLLEYTRDEELVREIDEYCGKMGFEYYVSGSVELDG